MNGKKETTALSKRDALGTTEQGLVRFNQLGDLVEFCKLACYSGMVPRQFDATRAKNDAEIKRCIGGAIVAVQYGAELGLSTMASLQSITSINGNPSLWGDGFWALVNGHPECEWANESFDKDSMTARCEIKRRGRPSVVREFSWEDAQRAQLDKKDTYKQYPKRMLQMRARGFAGRDAFPDALRGVRIAEEAMDMPVDAQFEVEAGPPEGEQSFRKERPQPSEPAVAEPEAQTETEPGQQALGW